MIKNIENTFSDFLDNVLENRPDDERINLLFNMLEYPDTEGVFPKHRVEVRDNILKEALEENFIKEGLKSKQVNKVVKSRLNIIIKDQIEKAHDRGVTKSSAVYDINIENLKTKNKKLRREVSLMRNRLLIGIAYFSLLCLAVVASIWLIEFVPDAKATISIEYNVGEIIGAILAGTGAAAAGLAYAASKLKEGDDE